MEKSRWFKGLLATAVLIWMAGIATPECAGSRSTIRFRMKDGRRMLVPVLVNGRGPYDFLLDTGTAISMIDEKFARELGLRALIRVRLGTFTGAAHVPLARVETLSVGPETLRDLNVIFDDLRKLFLFDGDIRGVLGQDFLSTFNYLISCRDKTIQFEENGDLKHLLRGERLESERNQSKCYVSVQPAATGERRLRFLLDSGSLAPLIFAQPSKTPNLHVVYMDVRISTMSTPIGRRNTRSCHVGALQVGEVKLHNLRFIVADVLPGEKRYEDGLLPLTLFDAVYFNNEESVIILNPTEAR